jgi:hypothetical protein
MPKPRGRKAHLPTVVNGAEPEKDYGPVNIHRRKLADNFTTLPNELLRDSRLSYKARGVLCAMLSMASTWKTYQEWIQSHGTEGREAIRGAVAELEKFGYLVRSKVREKGKVVAHEWIWKDKPDDGFPASGKPASGFSPTKKYVEKKVLIEEGDMRIVEDLSSVPSEQARVFPDFPATWQPSPGTKEQKLAAIPEYDYPSEDEFNTFCEESGFVFYEYRPNLYQQLCLHKWHQWREDLRKWIPVRNWHAYLNALNDRILREN